MAGNHFLRIASAGSNCRRSGFADEVVRRADDDLGLERVRVDVARVHHAEARLAGDATRLTVGAVEDDGRLAGASRG